MVYRPSPLICQETSTPLKQVSPHSPPGRPFHEAEGLLGSRQCQGWAACPSLLPAPGTLAHAPSHRTCVPHGQTYAGRSWHPGSAVKKRERERQTISCSYNSVTEANIQFLSHRPNFHLWLKYSIKGAISLHAEELEGNWFLPMMPPWNKNPLLETPGLIVSCFPYVV